MSSEIGGMLNPKFLAVFVFGFAIIVLYAKDKFNMPTYDREAMGPFSQLSPQSMTLDSRYRLGKTIYLTLMLSLYVAICLLGPATFQFDIPKLTSQLGSGFELGLTAQSGGPPNENQFIWPIAAATFLVSSAAANDNTIIGRVELYVRQYAHRMAYIPIAVSNLAFGLRNLVVSQWLIKNPYLIGEQLKARQKALGTLMGDARVAELIASADDEGDLQTWGRANILFYTLRQIFNKDQELTSTRLDYLTDLQQNKQIFEQLEITQQKLRKRYDALSLDDGGEPAARENSDPVDKVVADIRRFSKDTSLTIAVLLSQTARNSVDLNDRLDQLGFQGVQLPEHHDHLGYIVLVYASIAVGVILSAFALYLSLPYVKPVSAAASGVSEIFQQVDLFPGLATIFTGCLAYLVVFIVSDHLRDKSIEALDWTEGLGGYVRVVLTSSIVSAIVAIILITLFFSLFLGGIASVWQDLSGLIQQFLFQFVIAIFGAAFGLAYLRQAARLPHGKKGFVNSLFSGTPYLHACCAAAFVAGMSLVIWQHNVNTIVKETKKTVDDLWTDLSANDKLLEKKKMRSEDRGKVVGSLQEFHVVINNLKEDPRISASSPTVEVRTNGSRKRDTIVLLGEQLAKLREACVSLNQVQLSSVPPESEAGAGEPPRPQKFFKVAQRCELDPILKSDRNEPKDVGKFGGSLESLYLRFESLIYVWDDPYWFRTLMFPMITAFLIALSFGVGCRHWRAWWLYEGLDEPQAVRLRAKIQEKYGSDTDVDRCLITSVSSLDKMTPIEALRYEDYRIKLFRQVEKRKIREFVDIKLKPNERAESTAADGHAFQPAE